jgi:hypothetical protein
MTNEDLISVTISLVLTTGLLLDAGFVNAEPIGDFPQNPTYTIESMQVVFDIDENKTLLMGAIHNIGNDSIYVQGVYIEMFDHTGHFVDSLFIENPMEIEANTYGYYNVTLGVPKFDYYLIKVVMQDEL